jgi:hypothetical protein
VSGCSRVPEPPARMTPFMDAMLLGRESRPGRRGTGGREELPSRRGRTVLV